jgi:7,8-dihydropterin-6-yl-methyl-4-(beta-D-ribofuranosyl)aminobenzene 5'-phosphate synthase
MKRRFSLGWWPVFILTSPVLVPAMIIRNQKFKKDRARATSLNQERMAQAQPLDLPRLEHLEITPLVEWRTKKDFSGEPGVSYLLKTDQGALLFDLGFGADSGVLASNAAKLEVGYADVDALVISHLHVDHIGGGDAPAGKQVSPPPELGDPAGKTCYLPEPAQVEGFRPEVVESPRLLPAGLASTGPLARRLFLMGWCEEQALVARVKDKGLVVITGCGHPGLETILAMVARLSDDPIHLVAGGLHYPLTESRLKKPGLEATMVFGTGKPPWQRITQKDLDAAVNVLRQRKVERLLLSAHDTCDYSLDYFAREANADCQVLEAGATYTV